MYWTVALGQWYNQGDREFFIYRFKYVYRFVFCNTIDWKSILKPTFLSNSLGFSGTTWFLGWKASALASEASGGTISKFLKLKRLQHPRVLFPLKSLHARNKLVVL